MHVLFLSYNYQLSPTLYYSVSSKSILQYIGLVVEKCYNAIN